MKTHCYRAVTHPWKGQPMQPSEQKQRIDRYIAAYNAFDVDGMLELLAPTVRFENWSGERLTAQASGSEAFRQLAEQARAIFSEREQRITACRQEADTLVATIAFRGRFAIDVPDGPRAGTELALDGESAFRFDGGLIAAIVDRS